MDNNKRKTLDSYFSSSTQKKSRSLYEQSDDGNNENVILQTSDSHLPCVTNDEPVEASLLSSSENINTENQQNVQHEEKTNNETAGDIIDISCSCYDPSAQPKLRSYPKNHENRSFIAKWYDERPWLEYSIEKDTCYCYYCRHFGVPTSSSNKKPQTDAFVSNGFKNWRKTLDKSKGFEIELLYYFHYIVQLQKN